MESLYSAGRAETLARRKKTARRCCAGLAGAGLVACIVLCCMVRTINARPLLYATIATSTVTCWVTTLLVREWYHPLCAEADHVGGILRDAANEAAAEEHVGVLTVSSVRFAIPKSIVIRKVKVITGEGEVEARVDERLLPYLPENGKRVRVQLIRGYVTAAEVCDEA